MKIVFIFNFIKLLGDYFVIKIINVIELVF